VNRKELSAVIAECAEVTQRAAARTEMARADIEVSRAGVEKARKRQEEVAAEHRALTVVLEGRWAMLEKRWEKADARWEQEQVVMCEEAARTEKMIAESGRRFDEIVAELRDARDERRALLEALFRVMDRLPPPPPDLRSA